MDQLSKMTWLLLMGTGLQGDGLWMVLPWPDHSCLHLFLGILKQHCIPSPMPQKPSCSPPRKQGQTAREESPSIGQQEGTRWPCARRSLKGGVRRAVCYPCLCHLSICSQLQLPLSKVVLILTSPHLLIWGLNNILHVKCKFSWFWCPTAILPLPWLVVPPP